MGNRLMRVGMLWLVSTENADFCGKSFDAFATSQVCVDIGVW